MEITTNVDTQQNLVYYRIEHSNNVCNERDDFDRWYTKRVKKNISQWGKETIRPLRTLVIAIECNRCYRNHSFWRRSRKNSFPHRTTFVSFVTIDAKQTRHRIGLYRKFRESNAKVENLSYGSLGEPQK